MVTTIERANRVGDVRRAKGLTQRELAERMGCGVSSIASFEVASRSLRMPTLRRIARALGCSPRELLPDGVADTFEAS